MDDPLSAVDAHVGKHLFQHCIQGFLKDKSVILVTHQLQYLQEADEIIVLKDGMVEERGNFQYLLKHGRDFSSFLSQEEPEENEDLSCEDIEQTLLLTKKPFAIGRTMSIKAESPFINSHVSQASDFKSVQIKTDKIEYTEKEKSTPKQIKEKRSSGSVKLKVYKDYFRSGGNWSAVLFMLFMNILCQVLYIGSDIWLTFWTGQEEKKLMRLHEVEDAELHSPILPRNAIVNNETSPMIDIDSSLSEHYFNLGIFGVIVGALVVTSVIRTVHFFLLCIQSSINLHDQMFQSIINAPCRFFDTNPVGKYSLFLSTEIFQL